MHYLDNNKKNLNHRCLESIKHNGLQCPAYFFFTKSSDAVCQPNVGSTVSLTSKLHDHLAKIEDKRL